VELRPTPLRLPRGESEVTVYLVSPAGAWREVGRVSIRVLTDGGFERAEALPTLELGVQPQPAQGRVPELPPTPRDTFYDGTVRLGLKTTHVRNGWTTTSQANAVGVTYRNEAVRFAQEGTEAPRLDLSDYQLGVQNGSFGLSLGNGVWGTHRHLLSAFRSRGLGGSAKLGGVADLSLALVNGSDVVGFSNLAGVGNSSHRLVAATLGLELVPARPCALRVAGSESK
jgi:hypothetical protein